jgi:hypothetical protein
VKINTSPTEITLKLSPKIPQTANVPPNMARIELAANENCRIMKFSFVVIERVVVRLFYSLAVKKSRNFHAALPNAKMPVGLNETTIRPVEAS